MTIHSKILEIISMAKTKRHLIIPYICYYIVKMISATRRHLIHAFNLTALKTSNVDCGYNIYTHGHLILDVYPKSRVNNSVIESRRLTKMADEYKKSKRCINDTYSKYIT